MNLIAKQVTSVNLYIERTLKYTHSSPIKHPDCCGYLGRQIFHKMIMIIIIK